MTSKEVLIEISIVFPVEVLGLSARHCLKMNDEHLGDIHIHELYQEILKHPHEMYNSFGIEICRKIFLYVHRN